MTAFLLLVARVRQCRRAAALLGVILAIAVVAGCTGSSSSDSGGGSTNDGGAAVAPDARPAREPAANGAATSNTPLQQRDIVRTATLKLRTRDVNRAADAIVALADPAGGRVDGDDRASRGNTRMATLVLRVPPNALNRIISRVDELGAETSRSVHGEDVTARKADITARTASLQTSVDRLRSLLSRSGSIASLVALENQLTQRESELESMQAQQRALADEISLATLTVQLSTTPKHGPAAPPKTAGLGAAFVSGWHALITTVHWLVKIVGYALPIAAVVVLISGVLAILWHRRRQHATAEPTTE